MPTKTVIVTATVSSTQAPSFICDPDPLTVTEPDTTVEFQFGVESASGFRFSNLTATTASGAPIYSLSAPTIYDNGQRMTIVDIDNQDEDAKYTLRFTGIGNETYQYDPQIRNRPRTAP